MTNTEITSLLTNYKPLYHRKYWNEGLNDNTLSATNWGVTDTPNNIRNVYGGAVECYGYSLFLAKVLFNKRITYSMVHTAVDGTDLGDGWKLYRGNYSSIELEPGDIIRGNNDGHSAVVWKIENGKVYVTECWGSINDDLYWGGWNGESAKTPDQMKALATYIVKAPKTAPTPVTVSFGFRDGGVNPTVTQQVYPGGTYGTVPSPTNANDLGTFIGWWDHVLDQIKEYDGDTVVTATTDHTLYAHWGDPFKITNVGANKCLNIHGDQLTALSNGINVTLWSDSGSNEQKWLMKSAGPRRVVKSVIDPRFGLNVYRSGSPYNCNIYKTCGNETDALVDFISQGDGSMKIKLTNYDLYLTAASTSNGANVYWGAASDSDLQKWNVTLI